MREDPVTGLDLAHPTPEEDGEMEAEATDERRDEAQDAYRDEPGWPRRPLRRRVRLGGWGR